MFFQVGSHARAPSPSVGKNKRIPCTPCPFFEQLFHDVSYLCNRRDAIPYAEAKTLGINGCLKLVSRARNTLLRLKSLSDTLVELASAIQAQSEVAISNLEAVENMYGLVSLPNDLLVDIFEYIVNGDPTLTNSTRWKASVGLSHVCQHFRDTALSCPRIWASVGGGEEMSTLCLSRSKDAPLDLNTTVVFGTDLDDLRFEHLLVDILSHAHHWGSLNIKFESQHRRNGPQKQTPLNGAEINQAFREVDTPSLERLYITNDASSSTQYTKSDVFKHWKTPKLQCVTSMRYFPLSLLGLRHVTILDITLLPNQISDELLEGLSGMSSLEKFCITLESHWDSSEPRIPILPSARVELPSVRCLRIDVRNSSDHDVEHLKRNLFSSLWFPGVLDLHIRLECQRTRVRFIPRVGDDTDFDFNDELHLILWDWEQFARVQNLHLEVYGACSGFLKRETRFGTHYVRVPLNKFPELKHLTLQSNRYLSVKEGPSYGSENKTNPLHKVPHPTLPSLQTITIRTPDPDRVLDWVKGVLKEQRNRGEWEEFLKLVAEEDLTDEYAEYGDNDEVLGPKLSGPREFEITVYEPNEILTWLE